MSEPKNRTNELPAILPPLPDHGVFLRTPADGQDWYHPDDAQRIRGMIPSNRVFCRYLFDSVYYHFRYGDLRFRLRPCLWLPVVSEGLEIGDQVETIGVGMQVELFVSEVVGMFYSVRERRIQYQLATHPVSDRLYTSDQLRLLTDKTELRPADTFVRTPPNLAGGDGEVPIDPSLQVPPDDEAEHGPQQ